MTAVAANTFPSDVAASAGTNRATSKATWYYAEGPGSDHYWRCEAPARALGGKLAAVPEKQAGRAFTQPNSDTPFPWHIRALMADGSAETIRSAAAWQRFYKQADPCLDFHTVFPKHEGVAVWTRPDTSRGALMLSMQEQGIRTLSETDDNYFADSSQNLFLRLNRHSEAERLTHAKGMALADGIVFSTAALRDTYRRELKARLGKRLLPEMFVCRNSVPLSDWPDRDEGEGRLRVGFMGSPSHVWDLSALAYTAFHAAHEAGCETVVIGYNPADPDPTIPDVIETPDGPHAWRSKRSAEVKGKWQGVVDRAIPWIAPSEYHRAALPLDIGLCPLRVDGFTLGKSDSKLVEYAISGAAAVCSNMPVYNTAGWEHEVNCLMAGSAAEFAEQTVRLIRDPKLRFELVTAAQEMIASERNEETLRREWTVAFDG